MARIIFHKNIFSDEKYEQDFDFSKNLVKNITEWTDSNKSEQDLVECYDTETGDTFFAPLCEDDNSKNVLVVVNGKSVSADYKVTSDDVIDVFFMPFGNEYFNDGSMAGFVFGGGLGLLAGGLLMDPLGLSALSVVGIITSFAAIGYLAGTEIYNLMHDSSSSVTDKKNIEKKIDVRGSSNQSLSGNPYPFVLGKYTIIPQLVADPYTEYEGERGENAYVRAVYCAGYAPLKLTDFKLGDFKLAYNRSQGVERRTVVNGLLKGYSKEKADDGDILDFWKSNDIELEIIQQAPRVHQINSTFQENTNIDLANRPLVNAATMREAGWPGIQDGETYTLYSSAYSTSNGIVTALMTPIRADGTVLSPTELRELAERYLARFDSEGNEVNVLVPVSDVYVYLLNTFKGDDSVEQSEKYAEALHKNQQEYYFGKEYINYGHIYPDKMTETEINAPALFVNDDAVANASSVIYKGINFPKRYRTNGVYFTESCPMEFVINLDAPNGLYATRTKTTKNKNS